MEKRLPILIRDRLLSGHCISATVVTLAINYRSIPDIPLSDYVAAVQVEPWSDSLYLIRYREISEEMLEYEFEYDVCATVNEETFVETVEEVEHILARYMADFSWLVVSESEYASG